MIKRIIDNIASAIEEENTEKLLRNLISYNDRKHALLQAGIPNLEKISDVLRSNKENATAAIAKKYIEDALGRGIGLAKRKRLIKGALDILAGIFKEKSGNLSPDSFILIARTYYLSSITILPKGMTIPEKKKEALRKGIYFIERAIDTLSNGGSSNSDTPFEDALRVKSLLSLEYNRIDENACGNKELLIILKDAVKEGCNKWTEFEEDVQIAVRLCELGECDATDLINIIASDKADDLRKAKICYFLRKGNDGIKKYMGICIKRLKHIPFSHRLWEDTTCFIKRLREDASPLWKDFAVAAYEACRIQENETSDIRLRWYWSRQRDLYDLAFLAAKEKEDVRKMAEISDSHKSRSSLRLSALEKMEGMEEWLKAYVTAYLEGYIKNRSEVDRFEKTDEFERENEGSPPKQVDLTDVPNSWLVVHFYLNQLEKRGYVIVYDKDKDAWEYKDFKYNELFNIFLTWQANYNLYKEGAAEHLVNLCKKIGKVMPFLFNEDFISAGKNVLFILHDFLHRLPLHGAISEDDNGDNKAVFLENHPCCYLPAWSFGTKGADQNAVSHTEQSQGMAASNAACSNNNVCKEPGRKRILLKNFEEDETTYEEILPPEVTWDICKKSASREDLKDVTSPALLVILCHGEADVSNPFNARLKLAQGGITHLEILQLGKKFKESLIILGACETDLAPPLGDILDEHISITTAFLTNGAPEILGTMWEAFDVKISEVVIKIRNKEHSSSMTKELWEWQKTGAKDYCDSDNMSALFYDTIVFRVIGRCI